MIKKCFNLKYHFYNEFIFKLFMIPIFNILEAREIIDNSVAPDILPKFGLNSKKLLKINTKNKKKKI